MGPGWLGWTCNMICIIWTLFISVLFSLPTYFPVTAENMNYASVITVGVIALSLCVIPPPLRSIHSSLLLVQKRLWYFSGYAARFLAQVVNYQLTATTAQGDTTKARCHTLTDTENRPGVPRKISPTGKMQISLWGRCSCAGLVEFDYLRCGE